VRNGQQRVTDPVLYVLLPKYSVYQGVTNSTDSDTSKDLLNSCATYAEGDKLGDDCAGFKSPLPTVETYDVGNHQTAVKLTWSGEVNTDDIAKTAVNFSNPGISVDGYSAIGIWMTGDGVLNGNGLNGAAGTSVGTNEVPADLVQKVLAGDSNAVQIGSMTINIMGTQQVGGGLRITNNVGVTGQNATNNIANGTKHSLNFDMFSNFGDDVRSEDSAEFFNLPQDSDGLGLVLTGENKLYDGNGNEVADTGSDTDAAYLMFSTEKIEEPEAGKKLDVSGFLRAEQVTDWSTVKGVVLYAPEFKGQDWYTATLGVDAPKASDQLFNQVSITPSIVADSPTNPKDPEEGMDTMVSHPAPATDVFYGFKGTVKWVGDGSGDGSPTRPNTAGQKLTLTSGGAEIATTTATSADLESGTTDTWDFSFDVPDDLQVVDDTGNLIDFTVTAADVDGYTTEVTGMNVVNTIKGTPVEELPLTGAAGSGRTLILIALSTLLFAGTIGGMYLINKKRRGLI
jgi:hypothetical protein